MAKKAIISDLGEKIGGARKDQAAPTGPRKPRAAGPVDDTPAWARRYKVMAELDYKTKQPKGTFSIVDFDKNSRFGGRTIMHGIASEAEAKSRIPLAAVSRNHRVRSTSDGKFEIWRSVTDRKNVKVVPEQFATRDDAMKFMAQNAQKIVETKTGFGEEILAKPPIAKRVGPDVRSAADIAGESFMKTLGMRGVEFGNWQGDRQQVMNHAYDAFVDLGHVTGIDPKDLSLKSDLGVAFGARGHGLSSARAHYEPDYGAINLTKMEGAGALAHEWFHALDHMLGRADDPRLAEKVEKGGAKVYKHASGDAIFGSHRVAGFVPQKQLPEAVRAAYKGLMDTLYHKEEKYTEDAAKVQKFSDRTANEVDETINRVRKNLTEQLDARYYKRNNKPATEAQLKRFDAAVADLKSGKEAVTWRGIPQEGKKPARGFSTGMNYRSTNAAIEEMSKIYKEVRGRSGFDSQHNRGILDEVGKAMRRHQERVKLVQDSEAQTVKTRKIPTEFSREAHKLDEGRVQDYWQTKHEMAARAFSAYVEDSLKSAGRQSDYLSYGSENWHYVMTGAKPFPEGEERKAINQKFDELFKAMRETGVVKPAPTGVNLGWSDKAREASLAVRQANAVAKPAPEATKAPVEVAKASDFDKKGRVGQFEYGRTGKMQWEVRDSTGKTIETVPSQGKASRRAAWLHDLEKSGDEHGVLRDKGVTIKKAAPEAMSIERFAKEKGGLVTTADVDSHIQAGLRSKPTSKSYERRNAKQLADLQNQRDETTRQYREAIAKGEIRDFTDQEKLEAGARGHPDNPSTQAAQRVLAKREARKAEAAVKQPDMFGGPSVKDQIKAAAEAKAAKGRVGEPMTEGLFGSGMKQMDLVDMAKSAPAPAKAPIATTPSVPAPYKPQVGDAVHAKNAPAPWKIEKLDGNAAEVRKFNPSTRKWSAKTFSVDAGKIIGKAEKFGMAGMIAAPMAAALVAYDSTSRTASAAGKDGTSSTVDATKAALVAGGSTAAIMAGVGKAISLGVKVAAAAGPTVGKVAARAVPGLGVGMMALGAYEGYQRHGVAGALLGTVGADAVLDIPKAPVVGGGKGRAAGFAKANSTYTAMQATKSNASSGGPSLRGWANPTVQAAAQAAKGRTFSGFKG